MDPPAAALPDPPDPGIQLSLLQVPQLHLAGRGHVLAPKDAALLALLVLDGPTPRAQLAALLWPDVSAEGARNNLRQRVFRLRRLAGRDVVLHRPLLALAPSVAHGLADVRGQLRADAGAATGELLGHLDFADTPALAEWVAAARQHWRAARREALAELAAQEELHDRIAAALPYAERLARDEPLAEHAQRLLMRLHYRRGDRGAALLVHERLKTALDQALGETPSLETAQLVALIEAATTLPVAPPPQPVAVLRPPRLVGRSAEWQALMQARDRGVPVLVLGEAGVGKSRLLGDFAGALGAVLSVAARPGDAGVPYTLLARLVQGLVQGLTHATTGPPPWDAAVTAELARLVPALGPAAPGRVDGPRLRRALATALAALGPVAVVLDDLQFADDASLECLPALAGDGAGPWWLLGARRAELPPPLARWLDCAPVEALLPLPLAPLALPQVAELLDSLALPQFTAPGWAQRLHRHTGGHPLFLLETLMALGQQRAAALPDALPLPHGVGSLIERRLAALSPRARQLCSVAALAGEDFSVALASAVMGQHALDLAEPWRELERAGVMQGLRFAHDMVQEVAQAGVPVPLRSWLHEHIARHLSGQVPASGVPAEPARLALHWRGGQQPLRAAEAYQQAAQLARTRGRVADECRLLREATTCFVQAAQPRRAFVTLDELAVATREAHGSVQGLQVAEELAALASDDRERAIAAKEAGVCQLHAMDHGAAAASLARAVALAEAAGATDQQHHARYLLALARTHVDGAAAGAQVLGELLPWAQAHGDPSFRQCFAVDLAIMLDQSDRRREAVPLFQAAVAFFELAREPANLAATHTMLSRCLQALGQVPAAARHGAQAVQARIALSDGVGGQGIEALNLGRSLCELGAYGPAITLLEPEITRLQAAGIVVPAAAMRLVLARVYGHLGQAARAQQCLLGLPEPLAFHQQALALWTRALGAQAAPARQALLDQALACFADQDLPAARLPIALDQLAALDGEAALQHCAALADECEAREMPAVGMLARTRWMGMLLRRGRLAPAHALAQAVQAALPGCHPVGLYLPALHAQCRQVALAVDDAALAQRCLQAALAWIHTQALPQVPALFRDSFLHRQPVNLALLAVVSGAR